MTYIKNKKRFKKIQLGSYVIEVQDYQYKSRAPVSVRVSGTILGEVNNMFNEPCYFYKSAEAMSIDQGLRIAQDIVSSRQSA